MDKNQAFEILIQVANQFRGTIQECNAVQEAISTLAKELKFKPTEETEEEEPKETRTELETKKK